MPAVSGENNQNKSFRLNEGMELAGFSKSFNSNSIPSGWIIEDGASYLTTTYPALFATIGYTFGGSGANFNVPNSAGRTHVGSGTYTDIVSGSITRTLAQILGSANVALTGTQNGPHSHKVVNGDNPSNEASLTTGNTMSYANVGGLSFASREVVNGGSATTADRGNSSTSGTGAAHNNMQPSIVKVWCIKT